VVLTGGRIAAKVLQTVKDLPAARGIDWSRVDLWWGDERFLPAGDPERNETQAREALLDSLPLDPARVHPMAASDAGDDATSAAARYAIEVGDTAFDVVMLGVGEDGHVASLFPGHESPEGVAAAVHGSPKPPPTRITLTMSAIQRAAEVWLIAAGDGKADAIGAALSGTDLPAAHAKGREKTFWLLDEAAAAKRAS
jgi:6-phosphogluconolactonase